MRARVLSDDRIVADLILASVNLAVAGHGRDVAWKRATPSPNASFPDYIWLDTGETPDRDI